MKKLILLLIGLTMTTISAADRYGGLSIQEAVYGTSYRYCDATYAVRHCDGRDSCQIRASNNLCGDPHKGERKTLNVVYSCGYDTFETRIRERETGYIECDRSSRYFEPRQPSPGRTARQLSRDNRYGYNRGNLQILDVEYGRDHRYCDATYAFERECDGRESCSVRVNNNLCGDPYKGKKKTAYIQYRCDGRVRSHQVREGDHAYLDCH